MPNKKPLTVRKLYQLGLVVQRTMAKSQQRQQSRYAWGAMAEFAKGRNESAPNLYKAAQFARLYDGKEAAQLFATKPKGGTPLGIGHVYELIQIPNAADRRKLQRQAIVEQWSVVRLRTERRKRF